MKYKTILADPPWPIDWPHSKYIGTVELSYPTLPVAGITTLPVQEICDNDCRLFLWTTNQFLPEALFVCRAWGFRYKMLITWCKPTGLGGEPRFATEHIILGYRGHPKRMMGRHSKQVLNWYCIGRKSKHSEKPEEFRQLIENISDSPRIELFARRKVEGWDAWGDEVESDIALSPSGTGKEEEE